jgi:membrane dipeptidase
MNTQAQEARPEDLQKIDPGVRRLYQASIVIDGHADSLGRMLMEDVDLGKRQPDGSIDIPRLREANYASQFFAVWVDPAYAPDRCIRRTLELIDAMYRVIAANPDRIGLALTASDVVRLHKQGKVAAVLTIEGGHAIENSLAVLRLYHRLGARSMTLTHSNTNGWADSSTDAPRWHGLNDLGREVVREMNRLGMMVDVSHVSDEAFYDVLKTSTKPVILSHSSCRTLSDHPRNATDDMIRALADKGGVIGINYYPELVDQKFRDAMRQREKNLFEELNRQRPPGTDPDFVARKNWEDFKGITDGVPRPPLESIIEHIDHVVELVGPDHVGLGSDFDGIPTNPQGMDSVLDVIKIAQGLKTRQYKDHHIKKILGGNFLRVFQEAAGQ